MPYFTYIVECKDKTLYTGSTNNLEKRITTHNTSKAGAKYTQSRRPVRLTYFETFATWSEALKREAQIKKLSRTEKLILMKTKNMPEKNLPDIFIELKKILTKYNKGLLVGREDLPNSTAKEKKPLYALYGKKEVAIFNRKPQQTYVVGIMHQKNFVGFYSMGLYAFPKKLKIENEKLKKTLKGKSCFQITKIDAEILKAVEAHIKQAIECFKQEGFI